jgi:predicted Zn-dependent protease
VLVALDRKDEALKELDAALALSPGLAPTILATRGTLRAQTGDYAAATTDLDRAIAAGIAAPQVFQARALARLELGDSTGARADVAEAVQRAGSNAQMLESIRTLEQRLGVAPR